MNERQYCRYCKKMTDCEHPAELQAKKSEGFVFRRYVKTCECDVGAISMNLDNTTPNNSFHMECLIKKVDEIEQKIKD